MTYILTTRPDETAAMMYIYLNKSRKFYSNNDLVDPLDSYVGVIYPRISPFSFPRFPRSGPCLFGSETVHANESMTDVLEL